MPIWANFERKGGEPIRNFRMRYNRVAASLSKSGIKMPGGILLINALSSIKLERVQLEILTSTLESKGIAKDLLELQRISVELSKANFCMPPTLVSKWKKTISPKSLTNWPLILAILKRKARFPNRFRNRKETSSKLEKSPPNPIGQKDFAAML